MAVSSLKPNVNVISVSFGIAYFKFHFEVILFNTFVAIFIIS